MALRADHDVGCDRLLSAGRAAVSVDSTLHRSGEGIFAAAEHYHQECTRYPRHLPIKRDRIESLIRSTRDGDFNQSEFGQRLRGSGEYAEHLRSTFRLFSHRYELDGRPPMLDVSKFRRPSPLPPSGQMTLFDLEV